MSNKTKVSLSIDTDLLRLAKSKYPNLSARVNQLLSIDLHAEDEESLLMKDIASLQDELELKMEKMIIVIWIKCCLGLKRFMSVEVFLD